MDCETFDRDVVDLLYEDGEDAPREALALHATSCARCGATLATLRLARDQASRMPRVAPPEGLTRKILSAEVAARRQPPLSRRIARAASWAGSLAMRPQFAMAALFCLAVGSSLLLLRARSDSVPGPTSVREEGLPSPEPMAPAAAQAPAASARAARSEPASRADEGTKAKSAAAAPAATGVAGEASPPPPAPAKAMDGAAREALAAAQAKLRSGGCDAALADLRAVAAGHAGSPEAAEATRAADGCAHVAAGAAPKTAKPDAAPGGAEPHPPAKAGPPPPATSAPPAASTR